MELFGIGPMELLFILLLALIIFGPKDIQKAGKTLGRELNKLVKSDTWRTVNQASQKLKTLPNELMREAGLEELEKQGVELQKQARNVTKGTQELLTDWTGVIRTPENPPDQGNRIAPPASAPDEPADPPKTGENPSK
jgi:Sec-independent protein translocase protein TatA